MKKLTDEQLSRVLSAHHADELHYLDPDDAKHTWMDRRQCRGGCLVQTALADVSDRFDGNLYAEWFDYKANKGMQMSTDEFLRAMEKAGIA